MPQKWRIHVQLGNDRMNRKSPFSTTALSFDAPSSANPREYLHKSLYCQKLRSLGYIFCCRQYANSLVAEPETDFNANGHSRSFISVSMKSHCGLRYTYVRLFTTQVDVKKNKIQTDRQTDRHINVQDRKIINLHKLL